MLTTSKNRFRPTLECLEAREVMSSNLGSAPVMDVSAVLTNAATRAAQKASVVNGVVDLTAAARTTLESDILARLPRSVGNVAGVEITIDKVKLNRLTLDKAGNFNGQLTVTLKYDLLGPQYANVQANIENNQLRLDSDNAVVRQFGKLEQRQQEWQPKVTAALDAIRPQLMLQHFGTQAGSANQAPNTPAVQQVEQNVLGQSPPKQSMQIVPMFVRQNMAPVSLNNLQTNNLQPAVGKALPPQGAPIDLQRSSSETSSGTAHRAEADSLWASKGIARTFQLETGTRGRDQIANAAVWWWGTQATHGVGGPSLASGKIDSRAAVERILADTKTPWDKTAAKIIEEANRNDASATSTPPKTVLPGKGPGR
jgi:hypothetical protein